MKTFTAKSKPNRTNDVYFGEYGEVEHSISICRINEGEPEDRLHEHLKGCEYYIVVNGSAFVYVVGINEDPTKGTMVKIEPQYMLMVEAGELHEVISIESYPFEMVVFNTVKSKNNKITR